MFVTVVEAPKRAKKTPLEGAIRTREGGRAREWVPGRQPKRYVVLYRAS